MGKQSRLKTVRRVIRKTRALPIKSNPYRKDPLFRFSARSIRKLNALHKLVRKRK